MITNLQIRNFRGLKDVTLRDLRRVNLLVGGNDTGKTSVLEALILLLADSNVVCELPVIFRNNQAGGIVGNNPDDRENFWPWLFYDRDVGNSMEIVAETTNRRLLRIEAGFAGNDVDAPKIPILVRTTGDGRGTREIVRFEQQRIQVIGQPPPADFRVSRLSVRPSHPVEDAEKYNQIALEREGEVRLEKIMREVEPRLKRLRYAKLPGTSSPLVFADIGLSRAVPATQMGQAFNRILHIYAEILTSKTNVLLVDEIENGIYSESLPLIWKGLLAVCEEQNVQIFATTHSRECVMAAEAAAQQRGKDELSVQRLQILNGRVEAVALSQETLDYAFKNDLEIRK
jgi:hypothetical protein